MTGITSSISMCSNALLLIGHDSIASFTEGSTGAVIASNLYESSYLNLLTNHRWRFASKSEQLARLSVSPVERFTYAFQIPPDCIYVISPTTRNYEIYGSLILCNDMELRLDYTYRVPEDRLPPYFVTSLQFFLAAEFAIPVTESTDKASFYMKAHLDQLKKAKFADSTQRPGDTFIDSPYTEVRY